MFVKFTCEQCCMNFHVVAQKLINKKEVACPNCEQKFSSEILSKLSESMKLFLEAKNILDKRQRTEDVDGYLWNFTLTYELPR